MSTNTLNTRIGKGLSDGAERVRQQEALANVAKNAAIKEVETQVRKEIPGKVEEMLLSMVAGGRNPAESMSQSDLDRRYDLPRVYIRGDNDLRDRNARNQNDDDGRDHTSGIGSSARLRGIDINPSTENLPPVVQVKVQASLELEALIEKSGLNGRGLSKLFDDQLLPILKQQDLILVATYVDHPSRFDNSRRTSIQFAVYSSALHEDRKTPYDLLTGALRRN